jgi:hypothetical protein
VNANLSDPNAKGNEPHNLASEEKTREFCYELALALRRIAGRKITHDLDILPKTVKEVIEAANGVKSTDESRGSQE